MTLILLHACWESLQEQLQRPQLRLSTIVLLVGLFVRRSLLNLRMSITFDQNITHFLLLLALLFAVFLVLLLRSILIALAL